MQGFASESPFHGQLGPFRNCMSTFDYDAQRTFSSERVLADCSNWNCFMNGDVFSSCERGSEAVMLLDIDQCSFYGEDANDLGILFQWMRQSNERVVQLYSLLMNPSVVPTYQALKARYTTVKVVLYTARSALVRLRSAQRENKVITRTWNPSWIDGEQVYFPPTLQTPDDFIDASADSLAELLPNERDDLRKKLERLLATRQAIREALSLDAVPDLVVTAVPKDVERTVRRLGYSTQHAYLWDDNEELRGAPRVLTVPPFVRLAAGQRARVLAYLHEHVPPEALEQRLIDFLFGAGPSACSLSQTADGTVEYRLPECMSEEPAAWPLPPSPAAAAAAAAAVAVAAVAAAAAATTSSDADPAAPGGGAASPRPLMPPPPAPPPSAMDVMEGGHCLPPEPWTMSVGPAVAACPGVLRSMR